MKNKITNTISRKILNGKELSNVYYQFKVSGQWGNGLMAYSMIDNKGNIIPEEEGCYYQQRYNGQLVMLHV